MNTSDEEEAGPISRQVLVPTAVVLLLYIAFRLLLQAVCMASRLGTRTWSQRDHTAHSGIFDSGCWVSVWLSSAGCLLLGVEMSRSS